MYLSSLLVTTFALMSQVAVGFIIPEGQPDGIYKVQLRDDGTENHVRIADTPVRAPQPHIGVRGLQRPPKDMWLVNCFPNEVGDEDLDHRTTDVANAALDALCGQGKLVPSGSSVYAISECVVAYYCNFENLVDKPPPDGWCFSEARGEKSLMISEKCGRYKPGTAFVHTGSYPGGKTEGYGYQSY